MRRRKNNKTHNLPIRQTYKLFLEAAVVHFLHIICALKILSYKNNMIYFKYMFVNTIQINGTNIQNNDRTIDFHLL